MGIQCGIVGVPNVGKSTLFNALTQSKVATENYPFCTIEPNVGVVAVTDDRLDCIAKIIGVNKKVPTVLKFVDIAGLVKGAAKGEGLGNRFLAHIREMDLIVHVVRAFDESIDFLSEIQTVNIELIFADLETIQKSKDRVLRRARTGDKAKIKALRTLNWFEEQLEMGQSFNPSELELYEQELVQDLHLLSCKPKLYVFNINESQLGDTSRLENLELDAPFVSICAEIEAEIGQLSEEDQVFFREELGVTHSALSNLIQTGYSILGLQTFFTFNDTEVRAWTISKGMTAQQAAGKIHTDMEKGFIRAEVMSFEDFVHYQDEQALKNAGCLRFEAKTYLPREGDIIRIRFHA